MLSSVKLTHLEIEKMEGKWPLEIIDAPAFDQNCIPKIDESNCCVFFWTTHVTGSNPSVATYLTTHGQNCQKEIHLRDCMMRAEAFSSRKKGEKKGYTY